LSLFYHLLWLSAAALPHSANEINARDIRRNFKYYHSAAPWGIHTCHENISELEVVLQSFLRGTN